MLNYYKFFFKNIDFIAKKLARRKIYLDVEMLQNKESKRKKLQIEKENLEAERNTKSKKIGIAKSLGEKIEFLYKDLRLLGQRINEIKNELNYLQDTINQYKLSLPNIPDDEVPDGNDKNDNLEIYRWGKINKYNFSIRNHIELGEKIGGLDFYSSVKLSGSRFVVMQGQIARLHRSLSDFMLDLHTEKHGYQEYYLPYLVNQSSLYCSGHLPHFYKELFHIKSINNTNNNIVYTLIPTSEVPLINLIRNKIIEEYDLPIKMTAHTPCFRSEAGSYGRDTHGLIRLHQFEKVEIVQIVKPENSIEALENLTRDAEKVLQLLNLPYRKVILCTGDLGFTSCKTYDLEVWLPSQNKYREVSSCSNIGNFQTIRMNARFRRKKDKKLCLLHTLNGSGLAIGRTLAAILENYQLSDGRIKIPEVLRLYMKGLTYIG